ncbi:MULTISPECIES: TetR/AcrR family transcriptional regulator [Streptomyces]|uniref:TetR family transcriptional regulatory protein n=2 Tax=Streptomyces TaxID=1883 RepID=Q9F2L2_STRCO|nr:MULTISPECIES: helix-turn-helix domain-containing protein [Streptomyces]WOY99540.1 helix-turn-helix domain-containing protein [Streptomyces violaceoruber]MDX2924469.1 helix-turn-helix domain containing protein [Streptomyces sp. NRRL_B-16638]MDX3321463.1 helix-turn-helix domain containing protein [Streptomyces sp. ME03-5684b]MDX3370645.1 helix-turn-helix domain containing protein [Streptomyces sp. ME02-6987-2C]MDX3425262.1 helix-turn-helix domain containing protein [Streptomyces sp. ME02-6985
MTVGARDGAPRQRRDARRNRELLLEAAHEVFTEQGLDAALDVIARRAGVGNATLYRHFPTRAALVDAVFRDSLTGTMDAGERARKAPDAWAGLTGYLEVVFGALAADRGSNDLMTTHLRGVDSLEAVHEHNRRTVDTLLTRLRDEGTVRADVTTEDVLFGLAALGRAVPALTAATAATAAAASAPAAETAPDAWRRPLALFLGGLRAAPAAASLPAPALTAAELGEVLRELGPHRTRAGDREPRA